MLTYTADDHFWLGYSKFLYLTLIILVMAKVKPHPDGHIWGLEFDILFFVLWQSDHSWLKYTKVHIWPRKFKVKVTKKINQILVK